MCQNFKTEVQYKALKSPSGRPYYGFKETVNHQDIFKAKVRTIDKIPTRMEEFELRTTVTMKDYFHHFTKPSPQSYSQTVDGRVKPICWRLHDLSKEAMEYTNGARGQNYRPVPGKSSRSPDTHMPIVVLNRTRGTQRARPLPITHQMHHIWSTTRG